MPIQRWLRTTVLVVLMLLGSSATGRVHATLILYQVNVDTQALNGQSGYLDFQFNPGGSSALPATATVTNFTPLGNLIPLDPNDLSTGPSGDVSGSLDSSLTLKNSTAYNDFFQGFTYGSNLSFNVTLSGDALNNPSGSTYGSSFAFSLYDSSGTTLLLTTDPYGSVMTINVDAGGTMSVETFDTPGGGLPVGSVSPLVTSAPEPSSWFLFASLLPAGVLIAGGFRQSLLRGAQHQVPQPG